MPSKIAVLSMTRARHEQLLAQVDGLSVGTTPPDLHVVISMGDRDLTRGRLPLGTDRWETVVRPVQTDRRALPWAAAHNRGAELALERGAEILVFLDDVVIPGPRTLERFAEAVTGDAEQSDADLPDGPVLWEGPILQLPEPPDPVVGYPMRRLHAIGRRAPRAPRLGVGEYRVEPRPLLFSASSFAMSAEAFHRVGGFDADYLGRGLESADLAERARRAGGGVVWVGGADAYRQPVPPLSAEEQARHALAHAELWRRRWGAEPDHPWLTRLVAEGLLARSADGSLVPA